MAGDDPKLSALEDEEDEDPYSDPFDGFRRFTDEDLQNVMADPDPNLMDMSFLEKPVFPTLPMDETNLLHELDLSITNYDTNYDFDGLSFVDDGFTISSDMFEPSNDDLNESINNDVPGEIGNNNVGETTRIEVSNQVLGDANGLDFETGGTSTIHVPIPTISDGMFACTCCKMLREIVHFNDCEMTTLHIFGGIGFFCHALLLTQRFASDSTECQPQTFHLNGLTIDQVKRFIEDYCFQRVASGLSLAKDTNAAFYQAMSTNSIFNQSPPMLTIPSRSDVPMSLVLPDQALDVPMSLVSPDEALDVPMSLVMPDEALDVPSMPPHAVVGEEPTTGVPKERERRKTPLAAQRERTGKLTLKDISMHFHLPIETAAKEMNLCPTVLKRICRQGGLMRWPHRKIKSLKTKIASLQILLSTAKDGEAESNYKSEIDGLQRQIDDICTDALKNMK